MDNKRGKAKIEKHYGIKDIYKYYKENYPNPVSYEQFCLFLYGSKHSKIKSESGLIFDLTHDMLYKATNIELGRRMGLIRVKKYKPKIKFYKDGNLNYKKSGLSVDWKATKELWATNPEAKENKTRLFHLNKHSRGYKFKVIWDKYSSNLINRYYYKFKPVRSIDRTIPIVLNTNSKEIDYYE